MTETGETYRWRGVNPRGEQVMGQMTLDVPGALAAIVEDRWRHGWRSLTVCRGPGPVPPPAVGPADVVAGIGKNPDNGYLGWWAEDSSSLLSANDAMTTSTHHRSGVPTEEGEASAAPPTDGPVCIACRKPVHQVLGIWAPTVWAHVSDDDARDCPQRGAHLTGMPVMAAKEASQ